MNKKAIVLYLSALFIVAAENPIASIINVGVSKLLSNDTKGIQSNISFYLYNSKNNNTPIKLTTETENSNNTNLQDPFKLIIHGYIDSSRRFWVKNMVNEYFKKGNYNVITVDWSELALDIYPESAYFTRFVGDKISDIIIHLNKIFNIPYKNFHLIGHSLGAHVAGFAGQYITQKEGSKLGRITGMDPAGPLFRKNLSNDRLSKEDAIFVDVIHTDGFQYGYFEPVGHIDFYANGGVAIQPGCLKPKIVFVLGHCSHIRAYTYFTESINSNKFIAKQCDTYNDYTSGLCENNTNATMGENVDANLTGIFYLTTNDEAPFAKNGQI